jgi:hypothetical protein
MFACGGLRAPGLYWSQDVLAEIRGLSGHGALCWWRPGHGLGNVKPFRMGRDGSLGGRGWPGPAYASVVWITMVKPAAAAPTAACLTKGASHGAGAHGDDIIGG